MFDYHVIRTKHSGYEPGTFRLNRPVGTDDYLLLHFQTPVFFTLDNVEQSIPAGSCILLSPGTPHAFYPNRDGLVHDWVHFMPSERSAFFNLQFPLNTFFMPAHTGLITTTLKRCEQELIYKNEQYEYMISSLLSTLLIHLKRQLSEPLPCPHAAALKALRLEIYSHPEHYKTTAAMADAVHLSRSRFAVIYKELFGIAPNQDQIAARISKASYLLSLGTLTLAEISDICGYQNIYHFIRQFRSVTGTTPGKYRKST